MKKRLHTRLALIIIAIAVGIVLIATISIILETHYHFSMYQEQSSREDLPQLNYHLEQALIQTILWTCLASIILAVIVGLYVARRISDPLVRMKLVAERMTTGQWNTRVAVSGTDELAELGTSLNKLAEQLQKQEQLRMTMTEDIAHELRTPLATLKSHMRAMEDRVWDPTPERIHACYEEIERLTELVTELEDLTHVESPGFQLVRREEALAAIIAKGVELVAAAYREKKVQIHWSVSPMIRLKVDPHRMIQILVNLMSNALKFTPADGEVRIEAIEEGTYVHIVVQDTGAGIPPDDLPYLFERFYRADKSRNRTTGGSGLGLTIVKQLVAAHGGEVWAESIQGAAFHIRLPK